MNHMPMYYNQTHNQLLLTYIKKQSLVNGLETTRVNNVTNTKEWGKTESNEKIRKTTTNLKKTTSTLRNMCGSR